ncbi:MAG: hypothetical protein QOJ29_3101, partial [Thermoleophilaceae bacterium]|nr:hypothetical protein [Thermoleophilaceae bacterium]
DFLHGLRTQCPDQLVLQVLDAHMETELLHPCTGEVAAEMRVLECPSKDRLLTGIAEADQPRAITRSPKLDEEGSDSVGASEHDDPDARR